MCKVSGEDFLIILGYDDPKSLKKSIGTLTATHYLLQILESGSNEVFSLLEILKCCVLQGSIQPIFLIYINDLTQGLSETGSYLYADNTHDS